MLSEERWIWWMTDYDLSSGVVRMLDDGLNTVLTFTVPPAGRGSEGPELAIRTICVTSLSLRNRRFSSKVLQAKMGEMIIILLEPSESDQ
jgi:hypothetical protein